MQFVVECSSSSDNTKIPREKKDEGDDKDDNEVADISRAEYQ